MELSSDKDEERGDAETEEDSTIGVTDPLTADEYVAAETVDVEAVAGETVNVEAVAGAIGG